MGLGNKISDRLDFLDIKLQLCFFMYVCVCVCVCVCFWFEE